MGEWFMDIVPLGVEKGWNTLCVCNNNPADYNRKALETSLSKQYKHSQIKVMSVGRSLLLSNPFIKLSYCNQTPHRPVIYFTLQTVLLPVYSIHQLLPQLLVCVCEC